MGLFLTKNHLLRFWSWLSPLNWIEALTLSLLQKLPPRKLQSWFVLRSFFLLRLLCISINLPFVHAWNTVVMSGLVLLVASWNCWINYKNGYLWRTVGPSTAASFGPLAHRRNVASLSILCRYLADVYLNSLNWFYFLTLEGGPLIIMIVWFFCHHS